MSANELRQAAETLRGFEAGDTIHVSHELAAAFAAMLDFEAEVIERLHLKDADALVDANAINAARLINGNSPWIEAPE